MYENWKSVVGYVGLYNVSDLGRIFNVKTGRFLDGTVTRDGYKRLRLKSHNNFAKSKLVHVLVAEAFIGPREPGKVINHKDANKTNNVAWNLEYITFQENSQHAKRLGLLRPFFQPGIKNIRAKLTDDLVREVRRLRGERKTLRELSLQFGVGTSTINRAAKGIAWKHLPLIQQNDSQQVPLLQIRVEEQ
jgi:hypothetical protein